MSRGNRDIDEMGMLMLQRLVTGKTTASRLIEQGFPNVRNVLRAFESRKWIHRAIAVGRFGAIFYSVTPEGRQALQIHFPRWFEMNNLFVQLTRAEGYCCPYAYLKATESQAASEIAAHLGVNKWTVNRWRRDLRDGWVRCVGDFKADCRDRPSRGTGVGSASPADAAAPPPVRSPDDA